MAYMKKNLTFQLEKWDAYKGVLVMLNVWCCKLVWAHAQVLLGTVPSGLG